MADITKPNLPDAGAVDYNSGDIDYLVATDAVYYVNANRPHRNLAHRDNLLESKLDTVIDWLNDARGSVADLDSRLDVSINEDGTLKTAPDITEIEQVTATSLESRARMFRAQCPSGWLPPYGGEDSTYGYMSVGEIVELDSALYSGGANESANRNRVRGSLNVRPHDSVETGDANNIYLVSNPMKVNVNGYTLTLESRPSKYANNIINLPDAPSSGARQDMVVLEAWKEEVEPGASDDVFFPFGNVNFDESSVTMGGTSFTLANTDQSGGNYPAYLASSDEHGYYLAADDTNIADFVKDERNNVGMTSDGKFFQVRWRLVPLSDVDPSVVGGNDLVTAGLKDSSGNYFRPQGQLASRPAAGAATGAEGILYAQGSADVPGSTQLDSGMFLGGGYTDSSTAMSTISGLSLDGFAYAIPVCAVHRRNSTAWDKAGNMNGAGSISSGTSGRPDDLYYDEVNERDIVDLRHRVSPDGWSDLKSIYEETLQQLLKSDLKTSWEQYKEDPDGNGAFADLDIYGTKLLRAEGIKNSSFDSSWDVVLRLSCNNTINARPDGMRNYYSDQPGEQALFGYIPNESSDGVTPTQPFTYTSATHTLSMDATDLVANDGSNSNRPQWSGRTPDLYWGDEDNTASGAGGMDRIGKGTKVFATFSGLTGDSISAVIEQETYLRFGNSGSPQTLGNGDVYQAPNGVQVTVNGAPADATNEVWYSGYFTGATVPNTGTWNKVSGTGPASWNVNNADYVGYRFPDFGQGTGGSAGDLEYVGEGYDLHSGKAVYINSYLYFQPGSGFLSRVPYDDHSSAYDGLNSIKRTEFRINGTQVLPGDGQDFHPFGSPIDPTVGDNYAGVPDTHTKATCTAGFVKRGAVVSVNEEGTYDTNLVWSPSVIKDGSTYKMWYAGSDGSDWRIMYAESSDGLTWTNHQMVVDSGSEGTYDVLSAHSPSVIKDGTTYKMWYSGRDASGNFRVIYCTSSDGITWSSFQMVVDISSEGTYDTTHSMYPTVIKDGSTYRMWYTGNDGSGYRILYADSSDGISWSNFQLVVDSGSEGTYDTNNAQRPRVIKDGSVYKMWYIVSNSAGHTSLLYTFSTDGKYWARPKIFIDKQNEGTDNRPSYALSVIKEDSAYKAWYVDYDGSYRRIIHCVLSMQDTANTGTSLVGAYSTTGTMNFAPTADDDVLVYYEARALQQDWSRLGGSSPNMTLTYLLKYIPDTGIMSTLGLSGKPATNTFPREYRDVFASLWLNKYYSIDSVDFSLATEPLFAPGDLFPTWDKFKEYVPITFDAHDGSSLSLNSKPRANEYISLSGLNYIYDNSNDAIISSSDPLYGLFGKRRMPVYPTNTAPGNGRIGTLVGNIGEKNKELFMGLVAGPALKNGEATRQLHTQMVNLLGRPLVR